MVEKVITILDSSKASSPDFIRLLFLRNCEPQLSYILAELFNMCMKEFYSPNRWKVSLVVTVFKNIAGSSRSRKTWSQEKYGHFSDFQYGFRFFHKLQILLQLHLIEFSRLLIDLEAARASALDKIKVFDRVC